MENKVSETKEANIAGRKMTGGSQKETELVCNICKAYNNKNTVDQKLG